MPYLHMSWLHADLNLLHFIAEEEIRKKAQEEAEKAKKLKRKRGKR